MYHAFKSEDLKDSHYETAKFCARYMEIIQMVLTLIIATRKTTSVCIVPNVHVTRSHQQHTICTCETDYTHNNVSDTHRRCCKDLLEQNVFKVSQSLVLCLRMLLT